MNFSERLAMLNAAGNFGAPNLQAPPGLQWAFDSPEWRRHVQLAGLNAEGGNPVGDSYAAMFGNFDSSDQTPYDPARRAGFAYGPNNTIWRGQFDPQNQVIPGTLTAGSFDDPWFDAAVMGAMAVTGANIGAANGLFGGAGGLGGAAPAAEGAAAYVPTSADKLALFGSSGYGAAATPAELLAGGGAAAGTGASASGGGGLLGSLGSSLGGLGNATQLGGLLGGVLGATQGGKDQTTTKESNIDPRMAQYLYGTGYGDQNSYLGALQNWFKQNQQVNPMIQQGIDMQKQFYTSPEYSQGFNQLRNTGLGLLGGGIAANPFAGMSITGANVPTPSIPIRGRT